MLTFSLQPYSRVNTENPYPILDLFPDLLMLTGLRKVVVLPAVPIFKCHLPGNFLRLNFSSNSLALRKMIPYSRPKLSDFYTLFQSKLVENTAAHTYIAHIWEYLPRGLLSTELRKLQILTCRTPQHRTYNFVAIFNLFWSNVYQLSVSYIVSSNGQ